MKLSRMMALALLAALLTIGGASAESIFPRLTPAPTAAPVPAAESVPLAPSYGMMANVAADEVTQNAQGGTVVTYRGVSADGFNAFGEYLGRRGFSVTGTETQDDQIAYALTDGRVDFIMFYHMSGQRMTLVYPQGTAYEQPRFPGYQPLQYGEEIYVPSLGKFLFNDFELNDKSTLVGMVDKIDGELRYDAQGKLDFQKKKTYSQFGFRCYNTTNRELLFCDTANDLFDMTLHCINEYGEYSYRQCTQGAYIPKIGMFLNGYKKAYEGLYYMAGPLKSLTETYRYAFFDLPEGVRTSADGTLYVTIEFKTGDKYAMILRENGVNYYDVDKTN